MIDNTRRNMMKLMTLLGLTTVVAVAAPVRGSIKERKRVFEANNRPVGQGYYGFGETW